MNMTPMEMDAHRQGETAARCGWSVTDNPHREDATHDAWDSGFRQWMGMTEPVVDVRASGDQVELFLPS